MRAMFARSASGADASTVLEQLGQRETVLNANELAEELTTIATRMRALGVVRLKTEKVEIELGPMQPQPVKAERVLTDQDFMFAATDGIEDPADGEAG